MVVTMSVNSICGYKSYVTAVPKGKKTHVHIETDCEKLQKWGCDFDLPNVEMSNTHTGLKMKRYQRPLQLK